MHPFSLNEEEVKQVSGGATLVLGEHGGIISSMYVGEEGGTVPPIETTEAIGEEGGGLPAV